MYVFLSDQVCDRIMYEHGVELCVIDPQRAHIALYMRKLGIDPATDLEHFRREICEGHGESFFHVGGIVATT